MVLSTKRKAWLKNSNSRRYKQLEYILHKMPIDDEFTTTDMMNWIYYHWENQGPISKRYGKRRKVYSFHPQHISRFLLYRTDVRTVRKDRRNANVYRRYNKCYGQKSIDQRN